VTTDIYAVHVTSLQYCC